MSADLPAELGRGEAGSVRLRIELEQAEGLLEGGVLFLNIVLRSPERSFPQAGHLVFGYASEEPALFRRVLSVDELGVGVETTLRYRVRRRAPVDEYVMVIQLFAGSETDPHRVTVENRLAQVGIPFRVVEAAGGER